MSIIGWILGWTDGRIIETKEGITQVDFLACKATSPQTFLIS
jgi:hypothetical protein